MLHTAADRAGVISRLMDTRLVKAGARHRLRRAGAALARALRPFGRRVPERLIIAPQDLRTSDPTIAAEIYAGQVKLAGRLLETHGRSPFELEPPSEAFAVELHGFSWLRHLRAAETALAGANARALLADWLALQKRRQLPPVAQRPEVAARRLISWLSQTPLLLDGADMPFYRAFTRAVAQEAARLDRNLRAEPPHETRLLIQIALMHYALAAEERDPVIRQTATGLCNLLDEQILPDGGHITRNPGVLLQLLLDLLPLKLAFISRRIQTPKPIVSAIDRMTPMLRMLRHADGAVALFNGMGATRADLVAAVLAHDDIMAAPPLRAPYSAYARLEAADAVLLADVGAAPAPPLAHRAHAAPAAFEFSVGGGRLIVNCGAPPPTRPDLQTVGRVTAAHSTLVVDDHGIGRFRRSTLGGDRMGEQFVGGARKVNVERAESEAGQTLMVSHDGYVRSFGLVHHRRLTLSAAGDALAGEDRLERPRGKGQDVPYVLRFHLHPSVRVSLSEDQRTAYLVLTGRTAWEFQAPGLPLALEESVFFASAEGARRTSQLVVKATTGTRDSIAWMFRKTRKS